MRTANHLRLLSIAAIAVTFVCSAVAATLKVGHRYRLFFPDLALASDDGERIESFEVRLSCGRFRAVTAIPNDWSLELTSPSSEKTTLRGSAGHGATALPSLAEINGSILVSVEDSGCFDVAATVVSATDARKNSHDFPRAKLKLRQ